jgi:adenylylsulfate kinase
MRDEPVRVLVISGSMGAGKTTVLGEASDLLAEAKIPHAAIDLDFLTLGYFASEADGSGLLRRNLAAVWKNYAALGIKRLLLAEAIDTSAKKSEIQRAIPECALVICRLRARLETMRRRVAQREPGMHREKYIVRVAELESLLDKAGNDDFTVENDALPVTEVARKMLCRAGWL